MLNIFINNSIKILVSIKYLIDIIDKFWKNNKNLLNEMYYKYIDFLR